MDLLYILVLAFIGSIAGLIGGVIFIFKEDWAKVLCKYAIPFASGVLISVSILHLIPEAHHEYGDGAFVVVLVSFLASFLFEHTFAHLHHHEDRKRTSLHTSVPLVVIGDTLHNFIDGVAIAAAYITSPLFGLVVTLSTFLHETPHEVGDFGILMKSGISKTKTFLINLFSASATFPGALFVYFYAQNAHEKIGILLAISAGVFLYLGASDFLPEVSEDEGKKIFWKEVLLIMFGAALMYILTLVSPEH